MDISSRKCACSASLILVLLLWSNTASARFFDVQADHPYADAIDLLTREGVLHGYENRSFQPEREINRAEFTKMLMAIIFPEEYINTCIESLSDDAVIPNLTFPDVPHEAWFAPSICTAWTNGIVDGYPDGLFRPEEGVTFVEAAKMLSLAFGLTGFDLPNFGNANAIWYQPYVEFLATENAIPMSINDLSQYVNRGEVAEMIYRLKGYPLTPSPVPQRLSKSTEEVAYPVTWKSYINDDYTFSFSYPSVWPEPYVDRRGTTMVDSRTTRVVGQSTLGRRVQSSVLVVVIVLNGICGLKATILKIPQRFSISSKAINSLSILKIKLLSTDFQCSISSKRLGTVSTSDHSILVHAGSTV